MLAASVRIGGHHLSYDKQSLFESMFWLTHKNIFSVNRKQENISFSSSISIEGSCQDSQPRGQNNPKAEESEKLSAPL